MKNAILISDDDLARLRDGLTLELELGEETLTLLYVRGNRRRSPAARSAQDANLVKARRALKRLWKTPEGRRKMQTAAKKAAATRLRKAQENGHGA